MKKLSILLALFAVLTVQAQTLQDRFNSKTETVLYATIGVDYGVLLGFSEVAGGNLNYKIGFGMETYKTKGVGHKVGFYYERFKAINYTSYTFQGGITFKSLNLPFTNLGIGDYWFITPEINLISRKGIQSSQLYNADHLKNIALGINIGIRANNVFKSGFSTELIFNTKHRPDITAHYGGSKNIVFSSYVQLVYNF